MDLFFLILFFLRNSCTTIGKYVPGNTNTGEGVKGKKVRTTSNESDGKSVSEKSKSTGGKCLSENSTGGKSGVTRTSNNTFKESLHHLWFSSVISSVYDDLSR